MKTYIPANEENIFIYGRCKAGNPLELLWSASGVEFCIDGSCLYAEFEAEYSFYEQWIRVELNGETIIRTTLPKGKSHLTIFENENPLEEKHIRIFKEVQPMEGDEVHRLQLNLLEADGELKPLMPKTLKLEVIGDSLTSGEGLGAGRQVHEFTSSVFTTDGNYAVLLGKKLNADLHIISQSGWGTYSSWDRKLENTLPFIYEDECNVGWGRCLGKWNFDTWQPDVIVVNLGSNDKFALVDDNNHIEAEDIVHFENAVYDFLIKLRKNNKAAKIIWAYGMIGVHMEAYIMNAIDKYMSQTQDENVSYISLKQCPDEWLAANDHPGKKSHAQIAEQIYEYIQECLK